MFFIIWYDITFWNGKVSLTKQISFHKKSFFRNNLKAPIFHFQFLPLLLLVICTISAASSLRNGWGGSNNARHIRRIGLNEYLVPPPPPLPSLRFNSASRTGRLANHRPTEAPGYFTQLMSWLNPFGGSPSPSSPPLQSEAPYPPSSKFIQPPPPLPPLPGPMIYNEPSPPVYDKPPLPSASLNNPTHVLANKAKSCNPCNKVPWTPIHKNEIGNLKDDISFASAAQSSSLNGGYLPPANHDVHQAASQEVRTPDFFSEPSLLVNEQDGPLIDPLSNPHLYPGAIPPLFKAESFNHPVKTSFNENSRYPDASASGPFAGNGSFLHAEPTLDSGYGQSVHPKPSSQSSFAAVHQEFGYASPDANYHNLGVQNAHGADLSSSSIRESKGHINSVSDQYGLEAIAIRQDSRHIIDHQTPLGDSIVSDHQPSAMFNSERFYGATGSSGPLSDLSDNSSQIDQSPPSSYDISDLDRVPNNFGHEENDLLPSGNLVENSHAPFRADSSASPVKIEDTVHFEESPLLDFTRKGESRTDSSSIPPNAIADFQSAEIVGTTLPPADELFGTRQAIASLESMDNVQIVNSFTSSDVLKVNDSVMQDFNGNLQHPKISPGKDVSYISPSDHAGYLWPILSTTMKDAERESFWGIPIKSYDNTAQETSKNVITNLYDVNKTSARQGVKRNKQVRYKIIYLPNEKISFRKYRYAYYNLSLPNRNLGAGDNSLYISVHATSVSPVTSKSRSEDYLYSRIQSR